MLRVCAPPTLANLRGFDYGMLSPVVCVSVCQWFQLQGKDGIDKSRGEVRLLISWDYAASPPSRDDDCAVC